MKENNIEAQQLRGFLAVARSGSVSKAATETRRTQPAISQQIKLLSEELGAKLFERVGQRMRLTEAGHLLQKLAGPLMSDFEGLKAQFEHEQGRLAISPIRIAAHTSVITYLLPSVLKDFRRKHPEAQISLLTRGRSDIIKLVKTGAVDFGITSLTKSVDGISYQSIGRFKRVLLCSKDSPLSSKKRIVLQDLANTPLIIGPSPSETRSALEKALAVADLRPSVAIELTDRESAKAYVRLGFGAAIVNEYCLSERDRREFVIKDLSKLLGQAERGLLTRDRAFISGAAKELATLIAVATRNL